MKRILITVLLLLVAATPSFAKNKKLGVIIIGDSWASLTCFYNSMEKSLKKQKLNKKVKVYGCPRTVQIGTTAKSWNYKKNFKKISKLLKKRKNIKVAYISLGGNDLIDNWNKKFSPMQETALFEKITKNIETIIYKMKKIRPDLKVVVTGYDFPNFEKFTRFKRYLKILTQMSWPNTAELNGVLIRFNNYLAHEIKMNNVNYIHHLGLMHYYYGNPSKGLQARSTRAPSQISPPSDPAAIGGDSRFPVYYKSLVRVWPFFNDAYHLGRKGFSLVMKHSMDHYLTKIIRRELKRI